MQVRYSRGFTLIELMVTVAVLAILAAVALPSLRDMVQRFRVKGAADSAIALLGQARTGAVKAGRDVNVSLTGSGTTWCIGADGAADPTTAGDTYPTLGAGDTCDCTAANACTIGTESFVVSSTDHANVGISGPTAIVFDGKLGLQRADAFEAPAALDLATFAYADYRLRVRVSPGGMPDACVPSGPSIPGYSSC